MSQLLARDVYKFIASFERMGDFLKFARAELDLQNYEINGILDDFKEREEQKYQIISLWKSKKGREATVRRLYELKKQAAERQASSEERSYASSNIDEIDGASYSQTPTSDTSNAANASRTSTPVRHAPEPTNESHPQAVKMPTPQNDENQNTTSKYKEKSECQSSTNMPHIDQESTIGEASSNPPESERYLSQIKASAGETSPPTSCGNTTNGQQCSTGSKIKEEIKNVIDNYFSTCDSVLPNVVVDYDSSQKSLDSMENDPCYPVSQKPVKGYIMILNNTFKKVKGHEERKGSEVDVKNLKKLWKRMGGCEIIDNSNLSAEQMVGEIRKFITSKRRKDCGFVAFFVMSHGNCDYYVQNGQERKGEGYFLGNDGKKVMISAVLKMLENSYEETTLQGIPKLIFFQICRGDELRNEFEISNRASVDTDGPTQHEGSLTTDNVKAATGDVLQGYATQLGYTSFRDEAKGSWYINAIVNIFSKHAKDKHLKDLMTNVHHAVSKMIGECGGKPCMQIGEEVSSLSRNLYFCPNPPY